jgi:hypothetical protein
VSTGDFTGARSNLEDRLAFASPQTLLAHWVAHWRQDHPQDFIFQHYIGGTADSADHWRLMSRLMAEIKRWSGDPEAVLIEHDDILKDFPSRPHPAD